MQNKTTHRLVSRFALPHLALLAALIISAPALAQNTGSLTSSSQANQVTCDVTTGSGCATSNGAVAQSSYGARGDVGSAAIPVDVWGFCRYIDNATSNPIFAGFNTQNEWSLFLNNYQTAYQGKVSLVHCSRPATAALGNALHVYAQPVASTGGIAPTGANVHLDSGGYYIAVDQPNYYRYPCSGGANCSGGVQSFPASVSFSYSPPGNAAAAWTTTVSETFTGLDSDSNSPSWKTGTPSYTSSPASSCGSSANNQPLSIAPTATQLCGAGLASGFSATLPWKWTCSTYAQPTASVNCQTTMPAACVAGTESWLSSDGKTTCSGSIAGVASGSSAVATATGSTQPTGSATFDCTNGAYTLDATQTSSCTPAPKSCSGTVIGWTVNGVGCSGSIGTTASGSSGTAVSSNGNNGSASFACTNGSFSGATGGASCSLPPPAACNATTASWTSTYGFSCSGTLALTPNGETGTAVSTGAHPGSASYACNNGAFSAIGTPTCSPSCGVSQTLSGYDTGLAPGASYNASTGTYSFAKIGEYTVTTPTLNICKLFPFVQEQDFTVTTDATGSAFIDSSDAVYTFSFAYGVSSQQSYNPGSGSDNKVPGRIIYYDGGCNVYATEVNGRTQGTDYHEVEIKLSSFTPSCQCTPYAVAESTPVGTTTSCICPINNGIPSSGSNNVPVYKYDVTNAGNVCGATSSYTEAASCPVIPEYPPFCVPYQ